MLLNVFSIHINLFKTNMTCCHIIYIHIPIFTYAIPYTFHVIVWCESGMIHTPNPHIYANTHIYVHTYIYIYVYMFLHQPHHVHYTFGYFFLIGRQSTYRLRSRPPYIYITSPLIIFDFDSKILYYICKYTHIIVCMHYGTYGIGCCILCRKLLCCRK